MTQSKVIPKATNAATLPVRPIAELQGLCYFPKKEPWNRHRPVTVRIRICHQDSAVLLLNSSQVIVTGAGIGGIASTILISHKVRNATIRVYDRLSKVVCCFMSIKVCKAAQLTVSGEGRNLGIQYISWCALRRSIAFIP